jgi:DNA-binding transcriptional MocR family regulator
MSIRSIAKANGTGIDTVKSAVGELETLGYLVRSDEQQRDKKGSFADYVWTTTDPFQNPVTGKPVHGKQDTKKNILKENYLLKNETTQIFSKDWKPDAEFANQMQLKYPQADIFAEAEKMIDYYLGTGKAKEVKDIQARFRTWMRNADKYSNGALSSQPESMGLPQIGPKL